MPAGYVAQFVAFTLLVACVWHLVAAYYQSDGTTTTPQPFCFSLELATGVVKFFSFHPQSSFTESSKAPLAAFCATKHKVPDALEAECVRANSGASSNPEKHATELVGGDSLGIPFPVPIGYP